MDGLSFCLPTFAWLPPLFCLISIMHVQCLEDLDEQYVNVNLDDDYLSRAEHHHQGFSFSLYEVLFVVA